MKYEQYATLTLFRKYFRVRPNRQAVIDRLLDELPAAILIDADRLRETTPEENRRMLEEILKEGVAN